MLYIFFSLSLIITFPSDRKNIAYISLFLQDRRARVETIRSTETIAAVILVNKVNKIQALHLQTFTFIHMLWATFYVYNYNYFQVRHVSFIFIIILSATFHFYIHHYFKCDFFLLHSLLVQARPFTNSTNLRTNFKIHLGHRNMTIRTFLVFFWFQVCVSQSFSASWVRRPSAASVVTITFRRSKKQAWRLDVHAHTGLYNLHLCLNQMSQWIMDTRELSSTMRTHCCVRLCQFGSAELSRPHRLCSSFFAFELRLLALGGGPLTI